MLFSPGENGPAYDYLYVIIDETHLPEEFYKNLLICKHAAIYFLFMY